MRPHVASSECVVIASRRLVQGLGTLALAVAVAACGGDGVPPGSHDVVACSDLGAAHSVVALDGTQLFAANPRGPLNLYTCVQGRCDGVHFKAANRPVSPVGGLSGFHVDPSRTVQVHVTAVSRAHTVFDGTTTVRLHRGFANGKGCPPTTWFARVSAHGPRTLSQDDVTYEQFYGLIRDRRRSPRLDARRQTEGPPAA